MTVIDQMLEEKLATNRIQASHMANGLKLIELASQQEQIERCRLYRAWRNAGEARKVSYANAIAGLALTPSNTQEGEA